MNYSGLWHWVILYCVAIAVFAWGLIMEAKKLATAKHEQAKQKSVREIAALSLCIIASVVLACHDIALINNNEVEVFQGQHYSSSITYGRHRHITYMFINNNGKVELKFGPFSRSQIYADEFREGSYYTIYFEKNSCIILRVEEGLQQPDEYDESDTAWPPASAAMLSA